jgi:hypothetical protein
MRPPTKLLPAVLFFALACGGDSEPEPTPSDSSRDSSVGHDAATAPTPSDSDASLGYYQFPCVGERAPTRSPDFVSVYMEIFCHAGCADWYCHGSRGAWANLDLGTIEGAYAHLVGVPSGKTQPVDHRATCRESELMRVEPGAPERSLLFLKVSDRAPCGGPMPPPESERALLDPAARDHLERWIRAGAPLLPNDPNAADASMDVRDAQVDASHLAGDR